MTDERIENRYDFRTIEKKWQQHWEQAELFRVHLELGQTEVLWPRHVPLSERGGHQRRPLPQLCSPGCRLPPQGDAGLQRAAPDGLGRLRPAGGERGHQARPQSPRDGARIRRELPAAAETGRASPTTGAARSTPACRTTTAGRSGSSCCCTSAGWPIAPTRRSTGARSDKTGLANEEVVNGRCWRCGTPGRKAPHAAVVLQDHRLCRPADLRPGHHPVAGRRQDAAAQLDRPQRRRGGRFSSVAEHDAPADRSAASIASSPRGPIRCGARPSWCWRRSIRWSTR